MKTMLGLAAALTLAAAWPAQAQYGGYGDVYPGEVAPYACRGDDCYRAEPYEPAPAYGDPYVGEPAYGDDYPRAYVGEPAYYDDYDAPYADEPAYGYDDGDGRDARCDYGCAHYHWKTPTSTTTATEPLASSAPAP